MRVISERPLREFWAAHPDAENQLRDWYKLAEHAWWGNFNEVRQTFGSADLVGRCYVFNVHGGHCRVIALISFDWTVMLVRKVLTHQEYDRGHWKKECTRRRRIGRHSHRR